MAFDIKVNISQAAVAGSAGFGIPLILVSKASAAVSFTVCEKLSDVETALGGKENSAYKAAALIWKQDNAPEKIAVYASTNDAVVAIGEVANENWRQLLVFFGANDTKTAADVAEAVEGSTDKMYFTTVGATANIAAIKAKGEENTVVMYYPISDYVYTAVASPTGNPSTSSYYELSNGEYSASEDTSVSNGKTYYTRTAITVLDYAVAAIVGASAGRKAGSFTYKDLIISGLEPQTLSDPDLTALHTAGGFTIVKKAGDIVTSEGKTVGGEFIDVIDSKHWIIQNIEYDTQKKLNIEAKVPYTDKGISSLATITANVLKKAFDNGMIDTDEDGVTPKYSVNFKPRSAMTALQRKNRVYTGGNFTFTLAGAVHTATINGELVI